MDLALQWLAASLATAFLASDVGPRLAPADPPPPAEEVREIHALPGEGRLRLENHSGQIQIIGWERDEVRIEAVKRADTAAHLSAVRIEVTRAADELSIATRQPPRNPARVDYTLRVPHRTRLEKVSTISGDILIESVRGKVTASTVNSDAVATDVAGDVRLRSVNGQVKATVTEVRDGQAVDLATVNGSVALELPADASLSVSAMTVNGVITTGFPVEVEPRFPAGAFLLDRVGAGGVKVVARTVNGNIRINAPHEPTLSPTLSRPTGEGARRAGEGEICRFKVGAQMGKEQGVADE